jgi:ubiquinone/menaquinone biosynthesis C-methylase UbiE
MEKPINELHFKFMALSYKFRDLLSPRKNILIEAGIKSGFRVLDYGCGPGSYIMPLAELVGTTGKIYALDIHPLAIQMVQGIARKHNLTNLETILSDCDTGLPDTTIDAVLLYDTLHDLHDPDRVLKEFHRVLKPGAILSLSDHHMKGEDITSKVTSSNLFTLSAKGKRIYTFSKV